MSPQVEKRRSFIISFAYLAIILGLVFVFFKYLFWIAAPFLLSFFFAVVLQKPIRFLDRKTKNKCHALWSILLVFLSIAIILLPLIFLLSQFISQIVDFINYLINSLSDFPQFMDTLQTEILKLISFLPESIYESVSETIINTFNGLVNDFDLSKIGINAGTVKNTISSGFSGIYSVAKSVPNTLIGVVIGIVAWVFFTKDYNYIVRFIKLQLPDNKKNLLVEIKQVFSKTIMTMLRAYGIIMFITFCELALGLSILNWIGVMDNHYVFIIAIAIAIFDILPVAGSGGILIPWALVSLITGDVGEAIGLIVIYVVISAIRQYIEPKIVGDSLGVNPIITLAGLYFGLKLFGFMGMFIVPLLIMVLKAFNDTGRIHLWKTIENN
ncbi:MAG: sporulation integral membrane protein YtvI [Clostridiales bacterium]|nr:sporulation integral membrane protein YtvI [Clostridiales bacterium]